MNMEGPMVCGNGTPFGFRSTPKIFKVVADTAVYFPRKRGTSKMHYLDYLEHQTHNKALQLAMDWCNRLGMPIAKSTTEGPAECIVGLR